MCDLMHAMAQMEKQLTESHGLTLNEAMVICCIAGDTPTATEICGETGLIASHCSKIIKSVEKKGYINRVPGTTDRRQMLFSLTPEGEAVVEALKETPVEVPKLLRPLFESEK